MSVSDDIKRLLEQYAEELAELGYDPITEVKGRSHLVDNDDPFWIYEEGEKDKIEYPINKAAEGPRNYCCSRYGNMVKYVGISFVYNYCKECGRKEEIKGNGYFKK